jgi:hypothetical protein
MINTDMFVVRYIHRDDTAYDTDLAMYSSLCNERQTYLYVTNDKHTCTDRLIVHCTDIFVVHCSLYIYVCRSLYRYVCRSMPYHPEKPISSRGPLGPRDDIGRG